MNKLLTIIALVFGFQMAFAAPPPASEAAPVPEKNVSNPVAGGSPVVTGITCPDGTCNTNTKDSGTTKPYAPPVFNDQDPNRFDECCLAGDSGTKAKPADAKTKATK